MADAFTTYNPVIIYVPKNNDIFLNKYLLIAIFFSELTFILLKTGKAIHPTLKLVE
ncbi:MAG: hypothetical protein RR303_04880 [Bacteroidales bacterium]